MLKAVIGCFRLLQVLIDAEMDPGEDAVKACGLLEKRMGNAEFRINTDVEKQVLILHLSRRVSAVLRQQKNFRLGLKMAEQAGHLACVVFTKRVADDKGAADDLPAESLFDRGPNVIAIDLVAIVEVDVNHVRFFGGEHALLQLRGIHTLPAKRR
ncbi:MAG: hypothetical protein BWY83_00994 [bacterium ADurb.Bin478]|nr:MAG: hypothetical protein BWY83_00994 [bacterium ADurb.Bin478]